MAFRSQPPGVALPNRYNFSGSGLNVVYARAVNPAICSSTDSSAGMATYGLPVHLFLMPAQKY
jgi:hypothetical protein